jgi:formate hydrogenlyase transcriptional activator
LPTGWRAVYLTPMVDATNIDSLAAQLQATLDKIPAYTWYANPTGGLTFVNTRSADYLGLPSDHPLRLGIDTGAAWDSHIALLHPEDAAETRRVWSHCLETGSAGEVSFRVRDADGAYRWFLSRAEPLRANDGAILYWIGINLDIEDRKRAEIELRQSLDLAPQIIGVLGPRRERLYANRVALAYYGVTLDEWRQRSFGPEVHPDDFDRVKAAVDRSVANPAAYEMEMRLRKGDGTYRWFLVRYNPLRDDQGQLIRWYLACTDIDDRRRIEERMRNETVALREDLDRASMFEEIVGSSSALQRVLAQVAKVAQTDSTVLILGETGTGKELVARAIHKRSRRAGGAFIRVNCAAIPPSLVASELFGHEKGAFTGALQRRLGRFEAADGGTIFLDEIGELPPEAQVSLLRVLQEREIERVGSSHPIAVDVRVLAATNRDLEAAVERGTFREDLFYRLNVFPIRLPPLRERAEDIPILVEYLVDRFAKQTGKIIRNIEKQTLQRLTAYDWPGNVRELQNVIERAVVVSEGETFSIDESWLARKQRKASNGNAVTTLADGEKALIEAALTESRGRVAGPKGAAAKLGIPRQTLEWKIRNLNIDKLAFRRPESPRG